MTMRLITRCPACTTMFRVVQDQLRISEGWVRCGHCDEVFDAQAHMQSQDAKPEPRPEHQKASAEPPKPTSSGDSHGFDDEVPSLVDEVQDDAIDELAQPVPDEEAAQSAFGPASLDNEIEDVQPRYPDADLGLSFMRQSRTRHYGWLGKTIFGVCLLLLTGALGLQIMVHERDRLLAIEPTLRPQLEFLCAHLECTLAPLRQIESVVIENSSFVNVSAHVYRLNVTLKNTASIAVALPALELTLTDLQDQAVIRRVILANELLLSQRSIAAGAEMQATVPLNVKLDSVSAKFSGYRLVIFYP